jgi:hypothetical protein
MAMLRFCISYRLRRFACSHPPFLAVCSSRIALSRLLMSTIFCSTWLIFIITSLAKDIFTFISKSLANISSSLAYSLLLIRTARLTVSALLKPTEPIFLLPLLRFLAASCAFLWASKRVFWVSRFDFSKKLRMFFIINGSLCALNSLMLHLRVADTSYIYIVFTIWYHDERFWMMTPGWNKQSSTSSPSSVSCSNKRFASFSNKS